jgi:heptosyltransferase-2
LVKAFVRASGLLDQNFDIVINPRWDFDSRGAVVMGYLCGGDCHYGFSEGVTSKKTALNWGYDKLFTALIPTDPGVAHEFERNGPLLSYFGCTPEITLDHWTSRNDRRSWDVRSESERPDLTTIGIGVSAGHPKRDWPAANFDEVIRKLSANGETERVIVFGGTEDRTLAESLRAATRCRFENAAGATFQSAISLMKQCRLFIGNDSGAMHMAAAVGVPVIEISCHPLDGDPAHENSPRRFGPYGVDSVIFQPAKAVSPCGAACSASRAHCIATIPPESVIDAAIDLLGRRCASVSGATPVLKTGEESESYR